MTKLAGAGKRQSLVVIQAARRHASDSLYCQPLSGFSTASVVACQDTSVLRP